LEYLSEPTVSLFTLPSLTQSKPNATGRGSQAIERRVNGRVYSLCTGTLVLNLISSPKESWLPFSRLERPLYTVTTNLGRHLHLYQQKMLLSDNELACSKLTSSVRSMNIQAMAVTGQTMECLQERGGRSVAQTSWVKRQRDAIRQCRCLNPTPKGKGEEVLMHRLPCIP
jgi:hypothetical protein